LHVDVAYRNKVIRLFAHLSLYHVELGQERLLRAEDHVKLLTVDHFDLGSVVEYFGTIVLGDRNLFDSVLGQIVVQKVHVNDFLHRFFVVDDIV